MGFSTGVVMIRGDHRSDIRGLFAAFDYGWTNQTQRVTSFDAAISPMQWHPGDNRPSHLVYKSVAFVSGWTVVLDGELLMFDDKLACITLARRVGQPVFTAVCQSTSNTYGFSFFNPDCQRSCRISDGEVTEDIGPRLDAESGIELTDMGECEVLSVMKHVGVDYSVIEHLKEFIVVELDESHFESSRPVATPPALPAQASPWWKFW